MTDHDIAYGELTVTVKAPEIVDVVRVPARRRALPVRQLIDITAVDWPGARTRFDVVYHLLSPHRTSASASRSRSTRTTPVPSLIGVFPGADWFERETYDLYGMLFTGHPDMRRILTDYGFEGHPLRKDFPLTGFVEVRYDDQQKRVVYEKVRLAQEFRNFDFLSPWEGPDYRCPATRRRSKKP